MRYLIFVLIAVPFVSVRADVDCQKLFERHVETDMTLSYEEFDQTMDSGFRTLAGQGCHKEAADLIEEYMATNEASERSLRWHVAQLRAMHGANDAAVRYARSVLLEEEDFSKHALRWNDYVLATIAFLEKDRERLIHHKERVADGVDEHPGNELNLRLLNALADDFEADYATALKSLH